MSGQRLFSRGLALEVIMLSSSLASCPPVAVSKASSGTADAAQTASGGSRNNAARQRAKDGASSQSDTQLAAAESLIRQEKWPEGETAIRQYLRARPDSPDAHALLGWVLFKETKPQESLREYSLAAKYRKSSAFELKIVALDYAMLQDFENADRWLTTSLEQNPMDLQGCNRLGEIKYLRERFGEAVSVFQRCLRLDAKNAFAANGIGTSYERMDRLDEAAAAFRNAITWQPKNTAPDPTPFFNLGRTLLKKSKAVQALPYLRLAVKLAPENAEAHEYLGKAYTSLNELQLAQKELENATLLAPEVPRLHYLLGRLYRKEGLNEKAKIESDRYAALLSTAPTERFHPP